jgi:DNA invertase Pin-like site-specific DNA recombinase
VAEMTEIESGRRADRPKLAEAIKLCRLRNAVLVIAKLDRLARDAHFLLGLQKAGVEFVACDMPTANRLTVGIMALVAEEEVRAISARTKAALAAAKARGVKLGGWREGAAERACALGDAGARAVAAKADARARDLQEIIGDIRARGFSSSRQIASELNRLGVPTARGGQWANVQVLKLLARIVV